MTAIPKEKTAGWGVIAMLAAAQFIMVLDTTVMNVSITQVAEDLNTTVVGLQTAITMYTLVMAAFMLLGGKLGDRWGEARLYHRPAHLRCRLVDHGAFPHAWSVARWLVVHRGVWRGAGHPGDRHAHCRYLYGPPTRPGLRYSGRRQRRFSRARPADRRVGDQLLLLAPRLRRRDGGRACPHAVHALDPRDGWTQSKLDLTGAFLSAAGLGVVVFGILRSSQWGWIAPSASAPFTPLGLSPVIWLISTGLVLLGFFVRHERAMIAAGEESLLDTRLLNIPPMQAGLVTYLCQQFIIMGTFFVLPLYLQTVLGYDALQTGIVLLPLSMALLVFALGGARLAGRYSPRRIAAAGLVAMLSGLILLVAFTGPDLRSIGFVIALGLVGAGNGLLVSQLGNVIMSSVPAERGSEAGGLQGTAMNLGASLGVALIGSILIASLVGGFQKAVLADPALVAVAPQLTAQAEESANFVSVEQVTLAAEEAGLSPEEVAVVTEQYAAAQIMALKVAFAALAFFSLLALWYVQSLPERADGAKLADEPSAAGEATTA